MQTHSLPSGAFRPGRPFGQQMRAVFTQIADIFSAIGEGFQNSHDYHELIAKGVAPREAARIVFETIRK